MTAASTDMQRFSRYAIVGVGSNLTLYVLFLGLVWIGLAPVLVSGLCYVLGVLISYLLNRFWTFSSQSLPRFCGRWLMLVMVASSFIAKWARIARGSSLCCSSTNSFSFLLPF